MKSIYKAIAPFLLVAAVICCTAVLPCVAQEAAPQEAGTTAVAAPGQGAPVHESTTEFVLGTLKFFSLGLLVYYVLVMLPRNAEENNQKKFIGELSKNDEVVTAGGIIGKVVSVATDSITVEVAPNVRIRVLPKFVKARDKVNGAGTAETSASSDKASDKGKLPTRAGSPKS